MATPCASAVLRLHQSLPATIAASTCQWLEALMHGLPVCNHRFGRTGASSTARTSRRTRYSGRPPSKRMLTATARS